MRCALVNSATRIVENVIVADPATDQAPDGFELAEMADDCTASIGWLYSTTRGFIPPADAVVSQREQARAAELGIQREGFTF